MPERLCPYCATDTPASTSTTIEGLTQTEPGDVSICVYCAGVAIFTERGLRRPTDEERAELDADPDVRIAVDAVRMIHGFGPRDD